MRFPLLKKISEILLHDHYVELLSALKLHRLPAESVVGHIGDQPEVSCGYFVMRGKADCYNFKTMSVDIANQKSVRSALIFGPPPRHIWYSQPQVKKYQELKRELDDPGQQNTPHTWRLIYKPYVEAHMVR